MFRRLRRLKAARRAALAAAQDQPSFDADHLVATVVRCHHTLERARVRRDADMVDHVVTAGLREELRAVWKGAAPTLAADTVTAPDVRIVGIENTADPERARLVVEVRNAGGVSPFTGYARVGRELWTFRRDSGRWKLAAIASGAAGSHHFHEPLVGEAGDDPALAGAAAFELAADEAAADDRLADGLVAAADARRALAEMATLDERFAWHVVEHVVAATTAAWVEAVERGDPAPLRAHAAVHVAETLVTAPGGERIAMAGLVLRGLSPIRLRTNRAPAALTLAVTLRGRVAPGARSLAARRRPRTFTMRWRLVADRDRPGGWRLDAVSPGWLDEALGR